MSDTPRPTTATPPNTIEVANKILTTMAALSGQVTDYNKGSQIRTISESVGAVVERQGISALATALQVIAYSAMGIFNIRPIGAISATGIVRFSTAAIDNPPPAAQNVGIAVGTLVQTVSGIRFSTTAPAVLIQGDTFVDVPVAALNGGRNTNVGAGSITQLITGLLQILAVTNLTPTTGGRDAETAVQAEGRLVSTIESLVGGSPVSVANSAVGVTVTETNETVVYAMCFEPWLYARAHNLTGKNEVGFTLYIDNGSGAASVALLDAVEQKLNGNFEVDIPAYRPAGVPHTVLPVVPLFITVVVVGAVNVYADPTVTEAAIREAITDYFLDLPFGVPAYEGALAAVVANAALGELTSLDVGLYLLDDPVTRVPVVTPKEWERSILVESSVTITQDLS